MDWVIICAGFAATYFAFQRPKPEPILRPLVRLDTGKCIGDPIAFHLNYDDNLKSCNIPPTHAVVLVRFDRHILKEGNDVEVGLCDQHLSEAEQEHRERMLDEPRAWQSYLFPLRTLSDRIYKHRKI